MDRITGFDLVIFLALLAMFIVGYAQGVIRRLLGIAAVLFSLILAAQLRAPLGQYLATQWFTLPPQYAHMIAFGGVFTAAAITLSIGIQLTYRPAPLFNRYPVLDEIVGGLLGVLEGFIFLVIIVMILDPYYNLPEIRETINASEFRLLRTVHDLLDETLMADIIRNGVIPFLFSIVGFLFPTDVRDAFARAASTLVARR